MKITLLTWKIFDISQEVGINIKVVPSRAHGRISLRIDQKERLPVLSVPRFCSKKRAVNFVNENMDWIIESLSALPLLKNFQNGETIMLFGKNVLIRHTPQRRGTTLENDILYVAGSAEFLHRRVKDYIKKQAAIYFYRLSENLAQKIGCHVHNVCIKDTKSRWGSCSNLCNINYNWRIALAPIEAIEYLMAHEVAHLKHQNHSSDFWNCVAELNTNWRVGYEWLKKNGKTLYQYK